LLKKVKIKFISFWNHKQPKIPVNSILILKLLEDISLWHEILVINAT